jgi:hypothetical protein
MQDQKKAPVTRRVDLSKCTLLSTYGRNVADSTAGMNVKIGPMGKPGILTKIGAILKPGLR